MRINLAGYNVDSSLIEGARNSFLGKDRWTPESISAAYARISRSDKDVDILRSNALDDIETAKKSNTKIVHGMGHASIAEHSVFNFDLIDISRIALEYIQRHRLISFTEKSQRYVLFGNNFAIPSEITNIKYKNAIITHLAESFETYEKIYTKLLESGKNEQQAKEDARYVLPLCTKSQMGMTINARNLEMLIQRLYSYEIQELSEIANILFAKSANIAPSLIKYVDPTLYIKHARSETDKYIQNILGFEKRHNQVGHNLSPSVIIIDYPEYKIDKLVEAILFSLNYGDYYHCEYLTSTLSNLEKEGILFNSTKDLNVHDSLAREYELIDILFELNISASCYAQLKRHRMTTQICTPYSLEFIMPKSIYYTCKNLFIDHLNKTNELYKQLNMEYPTKICEYFLTNAHTRKVLLKVNLRELNHIKNLRTNKHAQWEIKEVVNIMCGLIDKEKDEE